MAIYGKVPAEDLPEYESALDEEPWDVYDPLPDPVEATPLLDD